MLDTLKTTFRSAVDPEEFQSIVEQIIPFKRRLSLKQYIPKKLKPWGVKVWVRAGSSGYMYRFKVYQGLVGRGVVSGLGMAADVVMRLCDDIQQKNHKVFLTISFALALEHVEATGSREHNSSSKVKRNSKKKEEDLALLSPMLKTSLSHAGWMVP